VLYTRRKLEETKAKGYEEGYQDAKDQLEKDFGIGYKQGYSHGQNDRSIYYDKVVIPKINKEFEGYRECTNETIRNLVDTVKGRYDHIEILHKQNDKLVNKLVAATHQDIKRLEALQRRTKSKRIKKKKDKQILEAIEKKLLEVKTI
jgi:hypothetical protein